MLGDIGVRIFSILNVILLVFTLATQHGGNLKGLLSDSESRWLNAGSKVLLTGQLDAQTIGFITQQAQAQAAAVMPVNFQPAGPMGAPNMIPASLIAPTDADVNQVMTTVLASLSS
jgi:hypothetical protein